MAKKQLKVRKKKYDQGKLERVQLSVQRKAHREAMIPRFMYMHYDMDLLRKITDEWKQDHPDEIIPIELLVKHCKGDLTIAVHKRLINLTQPWSITMTYTLESEVDGSIDEVDLNFELPLMHLNDVLSDESKTKINRGFGLKTRWRGLDEEIEVALKPIKEEGFVCIKTMIDISVTTAFKDLEAYEEMKTLKRFLSKQYGEQLQ